MLPHVRRQLVSLSLRHFSAEPQTPNYRQQADLLNNPYRDQFQHGKKPRNYRERFIESKKNEPKPRIGDGSEEKDTLLLKRDAPHHARNFYKYETRTQFSKIGVKVELCGQVAELGVVNPTNHQKDVIPVLLEGRNCVFISPTGSGKTYTYLLPVIQSLLESVEAGFITKTRSPRILIVAPTKFLAIQISLVVQHLIQDFPLRAVSFAELSRSQQQKTLESPQPVDIITTTLSNVTSLVSSGDISTTDLQHFVIDEVDQFLDYRDVGENMAFLNEFIDVEQGKSKCQIIFAGAFISSRGFNKLSEVVPDLEQYLNPKSHIPLDHIEQKFYFINNKSKPEHVLRMLNRNSQAHTMGTHKPLIFCNFNNTAYWLHKHLIVNDIPNIFIGKQLDKKTKKNLITTEIPNTPYPIVTTDSFGYGLDFRDIGLVVNYEFPFKYEDYLRRSGRTGRLSSNSKLCEVASYVSYVRDKSLFNIVKDSTMHKECRAYSLITTNKTGWMKKGRITQLEVPT